MKYQCSSQSVPFQTGTFLLENEFHKPVQVSYLVGSSVVPVGSCFAGNNGSLAIRNGGNGSYSFYSVLLLQSVFAVVLRLLLYLENM